MLETSTGLHVARDVRAERLAFGRNPVDNRSLHPFGIVSACTIGAFLDLHEPSAVRSEIERKAYQFCYIDDVLLRGLHETTFETRDQSQQLAKYRILLCLPLRERFCECATRAPLVESYLLGCQRISTVFLNLAHEDHPIHE